jgi:hypothetical protein
MSKDLHPEGAAWPVGDGETAARVRSFDWAATPLGPVERWPQSLKSAVDLVSSSHLAMNLIWARAQGRLAGRRARRQIARRHLRRKR